MRDLMHVHSSQLRLSTLRLRQHAGRPCGAKVHGYHLTTPSCVTSWPTTRWAPLRPQSHLPRSVPKGQASEPGKENKLPGPKWTTSGGQTLSRLPLLCCQSPQVTWTLGPHLSVLSNSSLFQKVLYPTALSHFVPPPCPTGAPPEELVRLSVRASGTPVLQPTDHCVCLGSCLL